jgi:hypothetical protein
MDGNAEINFYADTIYLFLWKLWPRRRGCEEDFIAERAETYLNRPER